MKTIKPIKVILTHFNCNILNQKTVLLAGKLSKKYSVNVISAEDDMVL